MAVAPKTLVAATRWLGLLRGGPMVQARAYLTNTPQYLDLSAHQYDKGLELLHEAGLLDEHFGLRSDFVHVPDRRCRVMLAASALALEPPSWLDEQFVDEALVDPPDEARGVLVALELGIEAAPEVIRRAFGKVDADARAALGLQGEELLARMLLASGAREVEQISAYDDGAGYDLRVLDSDAEFHLEVKTTTKKRSLKLYLSRNEFEVSKFDEAWRLVVVGLDEYGQMGAIAMLDRDSLDRHVPYDRPPVGAWASAKMSFRSTHLARGLHLRDIHVEGSHPELWWR